MLVYREEFENLQEAIEGITNYKIKNRQYIGNDDGIDYRSGKYVAYIFTNKKENV